MSGIVSPGGYFASSKPKSHPRHEIKVSRALTVLEITHFYAACSYVVLGEENLNHSGSGWKNRAGCLPLQELVEYCHPLFQIFRLHLLFLSILPSFYPTAGLPLLITKNNRHSFYIVLALSPLAGPSIGMEASDLLPACTPTPLPTFPAGECHHAACSEHSCLANAGSRCGTRPHCAWQQPPHATDHGQLREAVFPEQREG